MSEFLSTCEKAAKVGGAILREFVDAFEVREKGPSDLVTQADLASQRAISETVRSAFPDHGFLGEESTGDNRSAEYVWIVDPLDGTLNFVHGVPHYAVSVALVHQGRSIVGAVYNPITDECYLASTAGGAFLEGNPLHVSGEEDLDKALVAVSLPSHVEADSDDIRQFGRLAASAQSVRRTGSAALNLCYVAAGRFDACWAPWTNAWDVAAGTLLIREAGGIVTSPDGSTFDLFQGAILAASSSMLHSEVLRVGKNPPT